MLIIEAILKAKSILLSTHKSSDGDGLGSEIAMFHALKKMGKAVFFMHNDSIPTRYHFLIEAIPQESFIDISTFQKTNPDLALIFDTHDPKLCSPLYENLSEKKVPIFFIDHHVTTEYKESVFSTAIIDESASCTGEIAYEIIKKLNVPIDRQMASALYASLIFDTQNFKLIRDNRKPFVMASELLSFGINYEKIQHHMFSNWTLSKMNYLAYLISQVTYVHEKSIAIIRILKKDLERFELDTEHVSDLVDLFMQIQSLQMAIVIREENPQYHKLSFRGRSSTEALDWARAFDGGGHAMSSGAWVKKSMTDIEAMIMNLIQATDFKKTGTV